MLGHTSIKVTERYAHFAPGALRSVANATRPVVHPLSTADPADLSKYSELLSGADGTRIRATITSSQGIAGQMRDHRPRRGADCHR